MVKSSKQIEQRDQAIVASEEKADDLEEDAEALGEDVTAFEEKVEDSEAEKEALAEETQSLQENLVELEADAEVPADAAEQVPNKSCKVSNGKSAGQKAWSHDVILLVLEMLANGTAPSVIPPNLVSTFDTMSPSSVTSELPSISFVRKLCGALQAPMETLAACRVAKKDHWEQCFTDGAGRRQTHLIKFSVTILEEEKIAPVVLSGAFMPKGESSEQ